VQKGGLLKQGDRTCGQKEPRRGHEEWPLIYFQVGRGLRIASVSKEFGRKGSRILRGLAIVGKRSFITV